MNGASRRVVAALLMACLAAARARALDVAIPRVSVKPSLGGAAGASVLAPGAVAGPASLSLSPTPTPTLSAMSAPSVAVPVLWADAAAALETLKLSVASRHDRDRDHGSRRDAALFDGARARAAADRAITRGSAASTRRLDAAPADAAYIVNDEGVKINGRAARYYTEVRRMVALYRGKIDLEESLDVMDDAYGDVLAKVSAVEAVARGRGLSQENTHLEETLLWVDGVLTDGAKKVAVHTHRVFFHHAKNPRSEIKEGIRRVDGYIKDAEAVFAGGGRAERQLGKLDEVELVFDARGYREIKDHIKKRGAELTARAGGRVTFKFLDDLAPLPKERKAIRARLNELARRYNGAGLSKIYEGVIYSRYVGLLLELKTIERYHKLGYKILQSGRELFDENGLYVTELDVVAESPEGKIVLIEAKSARVSLSNDEVLRDKVVYKLETYKTHRAKLETMIGRKIDAVVFSMDVALDPTVADRGRLTNRDQRKAELVEFLRAKESMLSSRYGYPVSFLFLQSGPEAGSPNQSGRRR